MKRLSIVLILLVTGCSSVSAPVPDFVRPVQRSTLMTYAYQSADFKLSISRGQDKKPPLIVHLEKKSDEVSLTAFSVLGFNVFECVLKPFKTPDCHAVKDNIPVDEITNSLILMFSQDNLGLFKRNSLFEVHSKGEKQTLYFKQQPFMTIQGLDIWHKPTHLYHHMYNYTLTLNPLKVK